MPLPLRSDLERELSTSEDIFQVTLRYRLWASYKNSFHTTPLQATHSVPIHADITSALHAVEAIQRWHPAWLSYYIDYDKDMYTVCAAQSKKVVDTLRRYQTDPNEDNIAQYQEALNDLRMLSTLAADINQANAKSRAMIVFSAVCLFGLYLIWPQMVIVNLMISLVLIPIYLFKALTWLAAALLGGVFTPLPTLDACLQAVLNIGLTVVFCLTALGLCGLFLNWTNSSPQGSLKLAHALDNLIQACENHCPIPNVSNGMEA